jgi:hypothetical protein
MLLLTAQPEPEAGSSCLAMLPEFCGLQQKHMGQCNNQQGYDICK